MAEQRMAQINIPDSLIDICASPKPETPALGDLMSADLTLGSGTTMHTKPVNRKIKPLKVSI